MRAPQLAAQIAARVTTRTTAETCQRIKPREALQEACRVPSAEISPIALQLNFQVAVLLGPPILDRNAPDFAARFAPQVAPGTTVRTTPGTVPGTVPTVVPGRTTQTSSTAPNALFYNQLARARLAK